MSAQPITDPAVITEAYLAEETRQGGLHRANPDSVVEAVANELGVSSAQVRTAMIDNITGFMGAG